MDAPVVELRSVHVIFVDEFGHEQGPVACTYKSDVKRNTLFQLRANFFKRFAPGANPAEIDQWSLTLNGVSVNELQKRLGSFEESKIDQPYLFIMSYKQPLTVQKRARDERASTYDIARRLRAIIDSGIDAYVRDSNGSNGMITERIFHYLRFIEQRLQSVVTPIDTYVIVTQQLSLERLPTDTLCFSPFLENPTHTSLVCLYNNQVMLHIDASGSISRQNAPIFAYLMSKRLPGYSLTYLNYQTFDQEGMTGYAGGNCSCFSLYHVPNIILNAARYLQKPKHTFEEFWQRFVRVCLLSKKQRIVCEMCIGLVIHLLYLHDPKVDGIGKKCQDYAQVRDAITPPVLLRILMTLESIASALQQVRALLESYEWLKGVNFTSDVIMLDLFLENGKGFQDVSFIGNAVYLFLQDVEKRGFVSKRLTNNF
jgi:hypothetical protein